MKSQEKGKNIDNCDYLIKYNIYTKFSKLFGLEKYYLRNKKLRHWKKHIFKLA